jgi:hypothetical protein
MERHSADRNSSAKSLFSRKPDYILRALCLVGVLISFCFLFARAEIGLSPTRAEGNDYGVNLLASSPFYIQITVRYNQLNLIEGIKHRKIGVFNRPQAAAVGFTLAHYQPLRYPAETNDHFQGTFRLRCLLLDLPPPSI